MTTSRTRDLSLVFFGKTRQAVLSLLYGHADQAFYLREIVRNTGAGLGPVQREVKQLSEVGILKRTVRGHQVYYQANLSSPVFRELKGLVTKTAGVADILKDALAPLSGRIRAAFIYGSVVRGEERNGSDVDVLVVGNVTFAEVSSVLSDAQKTLSREINPTVYPIKEFQAKLVKGHHFLKSVIVQDKIFLIGDENELKRLVK
ncbi:MAG: nucleotidyltransferase domain-containing protein [Candidatus Omnitrophica bacterium]|nr:nucleotidyltransferase domain-containing protein [Candidatus Omnitrophota bacterium]